MSDIPQSLPLRISLNIFLEKVELCHPLHRQFKKINYLLVKIMKKGDLNLILSQFTVDTLYYK